MRAHREKIGVASSLLTDLGLIIYLQAVLNKDA